LSRESVNVFCNILQGDFAHEIKIRVRKYADGTLGFGDYSGTRKRIRLKKARRNVFRQLEQKSWAGKMGKKKENIKLRDLEPSKDAKGGRATYARLTSAGIFTEGGGIWKTGSGGNLDKVITNHGHGRLRAQDL
jgi:hypothetical protein